MLLFQETRGPWGSPSSLVVHPSGLLTVTWPLEVTKFWGAFICLKSTSCNSVFILFESSFTSVLMYVQCTGGTRTTWTFLGCFLWGTNTSLPLTSACSLPISSGVVTSTTGSTWTYRSDDSNFGFCFLKYERKVLSVCLSPRPGHPETCLQEGIRGAGLCRPANSRETQEEGFSQFQLVSNETLNKNMFFAFVFDLNCCFSI